MPIKFARGCGKCDICGKRSEHIYNSKALCKKHYKEEKAKDK